MKKTTSKNIRIYGKWMLWVLMVQTILVNVSASIYAYKFTHFYNNPSPAYATQNFFHETYKLFVGPTFYKNYNEPAPPFQIETVSLKTSDDLTINAWYSTVDSSKQCVILFHGMSVNKSYLVKEATMFRNWGYNVLLIDFRAHGRSDGNNSSFGIKETDEVEKSMVFAKSRGNQKIIFYGVSLGAGVCLQAVAQSSVQPDAIIADMPFGTLRNYLRSQAKVMGFPSEPFATLVTFWIGAERGFNGFRHNIADYVKNVHCPVMIEWGEKDQYVTREETNKIFNNLASTKKKLVVYPNADHESFVQADPIMWQREVREFLSML